MTNFAIGTRALGLLKHVVQQAFRAVGFVIVRLPPMMDVREGRGDGRKPVGLPPVPHKVAIRAEPKPVDTARTFAEVDALLDRIEPWSGDVPEGYVVDALGILIEGRFLWNRTGPFPAHHETTRRPSLETWGEGFFELADWLLAARDARERFVAVSLGAAYGTQLLFAWKTLMALNPLPCRLVAVEPVPENCEWMRRQMAVNGIDPDQHWIIQAALGPDNEPVLFPVGAPGSGRTGCSGTNTMQARHEYAKIVRGHGKAGSVLENLLVYNSTGLIYDLGEGFDGEMKFVSAVTVRDVLAPLERIDLLEVDIQHSEQSVIPPFMDVIDRKARRVHIGTHSAEAHGLLRGLLLDAGWELVFDYAPHTKHMTELGPLDIVDGILSARNPKV